MKTVKIKSKRMTLRKVEPGYTRRLKPWQSTVMALSVPLALLAMCSAPAQAQCSRGASSSQSSDLSSFANDSFRPNRNTGAIAVARFQPVVSQQRLASAQLQQLAATQSAKRDMYRAKAMPARLAWAEAKRLKRSQRTAARIGADPESLYRENRSAGAVQLAAYYAKSAEAIK